MRLHLDPSHLEEAQAALHAEVLESADWTPPRPELEMLAGLWIQKGEKVSPAFRRRFTRLGRTALDELDFRRSAESARARINAWVSESTRERIPSLLAPGQIEAGTRRVLASAIYFKAPWEAPSSRPRPGPCGFVDRTGRAPSRECS